MFCIFYLRYLYLYKSWHTHIYQVTFISHGVPWFYVWLIITLIRLSLIHHTLYTRGNVINLSHLLRLSLVWNENLTPSSLSCKSNCWWSDWDPSSHIWWPSKISFQSLSRMEFWIDPFNLINNGNDALKFWFRVGSGHNILFHQIPWKQCVTNIYKESTMPWSIQHVASPIHVTKGANREVKNFGKCIP